MIVLGLKSCLVSIVDRRMGVSRRPTLHSKTACLKRDKKSWKNPSSATTATASFRPRRPGGDTTLPTSRCPTTSSPTYNLSSASFATSTLLRLKAWESTSRCTTRTCQSRSSVPSQTAARPLPARGEDALTSFSTRKRKTPENFPAKRVPELFLPD